MVTELQAAVAQQRYRTDWQTVFTDGTVVRHDRVGWWVLDPSRLAAGRVYPSRAEAELAATRGDVP